MRYFIIFCLSYSAYGGLEELKACKDKHKEPNAFYGCVKPYLDKDLSEFRKKRQAGWLYMNEINEESLKTIQFSEKSIKVSLEQLITKLDVTSFPSSLGPRIKKEKRNFSDYGLFITKKSDSTALLKTKDNSWFFKITLLSENKGHYILCIEDKANNGGSYHSQKLFRFTKNEDELFYKGIEINLKSNKCPRFQR